MKKGDLLKNPIQYLDLNDISGFDQPIWELEAASFRSRSLEKSKAIFGSTPEGERTKIFRSIAGAVNPGSSNEAALGITENQTYVGGGIPENETRHIDLMPGTMGYTEVDGHMYDFQITTNDPKRGDLSGCIFEEVQLCGNTARDAHMAAVYIDPTTVLPLIVGAFSQSNKDFYKTKSFTWVEDQLERIER